MRSIEVQICKGGKHIITMSIGKIEELGLYIKSEGLEYINARNGNKIEFILNAYDHKISGILERTK